MDVFKAPFLTEEACNDILAVAEENGKWTPKTDVISYFIKLN